MLPVCSYYSWRLQGCRDGYGGEIAMWLGFLACAMSSLDGSACLEVPPGPYKGGQVYGTTLFEPVYNLGVSFFDLSL